MGKLKIAVISGGKSPEAAVSLKSGENIYNSLDKNLYEVFNYDATTDLVKFIIDASTKKFDLVFPAMHGPYGEDGKLQGLLDMIDMPYIFSDTTASAVANDKYLSKSVLSNTDVLTPKYVLLNKKSKTGFKDLMISVSIPFIVKPLRLGSSLGVSVVHTIDDYDDAAKKAFEYGDDILVEEFIRGRELTVLVIGNKLPEALSVIEIVPKKAEWYDYNSKYDIDGSDKICPAPISDELRRDIQKKAVTVYTEIGCKDLARVDFMLSTDLNVPYFIDINTIPGFSETSLAKIAAKDEGLSFTDLLDKLINGAVKYYGLENKTKEKSIDEEVEEIE